MESKSPTVLNKLTAAIASAFALGALPAAALPTYAITQLAPTSSCGAVSINNVSDVTGSCNGTAVVWHDGVAASLGRLAGGTFSQANYVNTFGVVAGDGDTGNGRPQGWVQTPSGLFNFFPNNGGNTHALFIGDNGYIGGYYTKSLSGNTASWRGAIWTVDPKDPRKYRETDLPVLPGGINTKLTSSVPMAFNQLGQAAGYGSTDQTSQHAMFWKNDAAHTIVDLGVFPGDWTSLAWGMNDLGQVVGESHPPAGSRPVMWNSDAAHTVAELPLLPGDNYGSASHINLQGQVIGFSGYAVPGTWNLTQSSAVIWRDGGVFDLQSLLDPVTGAGWTIENAAGMNDLGQIVGTGTYNGTPSVFVMTPAAQ